MDTSKIIRGVVSNGRYTVTAPIVKEDYGLYLKIEGVELPSTYEVDFSNSENSGTSVTMIGNSEGVLIPREFIETGKDIFAFLYVVGINYGRTVYKFRIPNKLRPDRTNIAPTPEEQSVIDQTISALNTAVAQTAQDVIDADASAQSAQEYAEQAETARDTAQGYASNAQLSATQASNSAISANQSASASAQSASQSAQIKADVEGLADDAQGYAQASAQSASASATSATQAQGYAQSASASAQSASGYASSAQTSANTASAKAQDASQSATTASAKAQDASQSATTASAKATESAQSASQALGYKTDAESARDDAESARDEAQQAVASISGALAEKAPIITDTASGAIASFSDGADDLPLKSLVVNIDPVQDLSHGDPSPENICPISGWTEVDVEQRGKNLLDASTEENGYISSAGVVTVDYASTHSALIKVIPGATYTFSGTASSIGAGNKRIHAYSKDGEWLSQITYANVQANTAFSVQAQIPSGVEYVKLSYYKTDTNKQFELGPTATPYDPYTGRSITINLGQTVYGGHLDVLSGVLTVDRYVVDPSQWTQYGASNRYKAYRITNVPRAFGQSNAVNKPLSNMISEFGAFSSSSMNKNIIQPPYPNYSYSNVFMALEDDIDPTSVEFSYILREPIEIQLTPQQVNSLLGVNNIWADSGDTEVVYRADTKAYIAKKIAEAISALS